MIDFLLSSQLPGKGADLAVGTDLTSIFVNIALAVGVVILKPAVEQRFRFTLDQYTATTIDSRQSIKAVVNARHDLLSPVLDGLSTLQLKVKPAQATIATATTVVKLAPTPVQIFQEQSTMVPIWGIFACAILALVGTVLAFERYRQTDSNWSSPSGASSSGSSLEPYSRDSSPQPFSRSSTPPDDDPPDDPSGSDGHPPPLPIFDIFYDAPVLRVDKGTDTSDDQVRDMDGAPPPPPPSFPTPVDDGDAFQSNPISRWLPLTLVLSIISFVINRLFKCFFRSHGKTRNIVSTPTVSERITVNEISANFAPLSPSATAKRVIKPTLVTKPTCPNLFPLVEFGPESLNVNVSTPDMCPVSHPVYIPVSQRSRKFMGTVLSFLALACSSLGPLIAQFFVDHHLGKIVDFFFPTSGGSKNRSSSKALDTGAVNESVGVDESVGIDGEDDTDGSDEDIVDADEESVIDGEETDDLAAGNDEETIASGNDEEEDVDTGDEETKDDSTASSDEEAVVAVTDEDVDTGHEEKDADRAEEAVAAVTDEEDVNTEDDLTASRAEEAVAAVTDEEDVDTGNKEGDDVTAGRAEEAVTDKENDTEDDLTASRAEEAVTAVTDEDVDTGHEEKDADRAEEAVAAVTEEDIGIGNEGDGLTAGRVGKTIAAGTDEGVDIGNEDKDDMTASGAEETVAAVNDEDDTGTSETNATDGEVVATRGEDTAAVVNDEGGDEANVISGIRKTDDLTAGWEEIEVIGDNEKVDDLAAGGNDKKIDGLMKPSAQQELSFNNVGNTTLVVFEKASPLAVDLEDILDASDDGVPFLEVFRALSISDFSDEIPVVKKTPKTSTGSDILATTVDGNQDVEIPSKPIPKTNIPVVVKKVQTVSKSIPEKVASVTENVPSSSKINIQGSSTSAPPPSSRPKPGLRASIHAPSSQPRRTSIHAPSSQPMLDLTASIHAPSSQSTPNPGASIRASSSQPRRTSIHAPSSQPKLDLTASIHAPNSQSTPNPSASIRASSSQPRRASIHVPSSRARPTSSASIDFPSSQSRPGSSASIHTRGSRPRLDSSASIPAPSAQPRSDSSASLHAPSPQSRPDTSASIYASSSQSTPDPSTSVHLPRTPPRNGLNTSIHAPTQHKLPLGPVPIPVVKLSPEHRGPRVNDSMRRRDITSVHVPRTPPSKISIHAPTRHEPKLPIPIPVVHLSPERYERRVMDTKRECNVVVLVSAGSGLPKSVAPEVVA